MPTDTQLMRTSSRQLREMPAAFSPAQVRDAWDLSLATHKDDGLAEKNQPAYEYLRARGLAELSDAGEDAYGIAPLDGLAEGCDVWHAKPGRPWGYEIVVPLYDLDGEIVSLQARTTCRATGDAPRVLTPRSGRGSGVVFASARGLALFRGEQPAGPVLLGEGLTDHLTLTLAAAGRCPVLSTPGASVARSAIREWARGRTVLVALDQDEAGERAACEVAERVWAQGGWPRRMRWDEAEKDANDALLAASLERFMDELLAAIEEVKA